MKHSVSFYFDEHVASAVVKALRQQGVSVTTVAEMGLIGAPDELHLKTASYLGLVVFTQDEDYIALHQQGYRHAGIVYARQHTPLRQVISGLKLIHDIMTREEMVNHLETLP